MVRPATSTARTLAALLAVSLVAPAAAMYSSSGPVINLDPESFKQQLAGDGLWLVEFYAPWCAATKPPAIPIACQGLMWWAWHAGLLPPLSGAARRERSVPSLEPPWRRGQIHNSVKYRHFSRYPVLLCCRPHPPDPPAQHQYSAFNELKGHRSALLKIDISSITIHDFTLTVSAFLPQQQPAFSWLHSSF